MTQPDQDIASSSSLSSNDEVSLTPTKKKELTVIQENYHENSSSDLDDDI